VLQYSKIRGKLCGTIHSLYNCQCNPHKAKFSINPIPSLGTKNQGDEGTAETYSVFRLDKFPMCVGMDPLSLLLWRSLCKQL
jgi:hypothetical protein